MHVVTDCAKVAFQAGLLEGLFLPSYPDSIPRPIIIITPVLKPYTDIY